MKIGPKIRLFLNISTLLKNCLIDFFKIFFSNLGLGILQLKYQKVPIFKVLSPRKENFRPKLEKELKNLFSSFF